MSIQAAIEGQQLREDLRNCGELGGFFERGLRECFPWAPEFEIRASREKILKFLEIEREHGLTTEGGRRTERTGSERRAPYATMASRIVVFPVLGRRWAFTAVLPTAGAEGASVSSAAVMGWRDLWKTLRASPSSSEQVDILTNFGSDKMNESWVALGAAPAGSIRKRIHLIGQGMLSKLGPTESFFKAIPKDAGLVEIVHPNHVNPRLVRRRVRHLASSGEVIHRKYMYGSVALLPFSLLLGILPLPNIVLAWNLFRAYSHWRALQGSRRLHYLVTDSGTAVPSSLADAAPGTDKSVDSDDDEDDVGEAEKREKAKHWVFVPSEVLDALLGRVNVLREPISDVTVAEVCKEYPVDANEILKWRDDRLPIKSFG